MSQSCTAEIGSSNVDQQVVSSFGEEWRKFDHAQSSEQEMRQYFEAYFQLFPWHLISRESVGFDLGCGSGRWAYFVAPKVGTLHCIDPSSEALAVTKEKLSAFSNCRFHLAAADSIPMTDGSADFGYSIGVLHHLPDTARGIEDAARKLKPGAPLLLYLYYRFDNRPWWFRAMWWTSDVARRLICRLPSRARLLVADVLAVTVYWPLARLAAVLEKLGISVDYFPLSAYRHRSFVFLRNDSLDKFGTAIEHRFTRDEIRSMMTRAGLENISFTSGMPFWCAVGYKRASAG